MLFVSHLSCYHVIMFNRRPKEVEHLTVQYYKESVSNRRQEHDEVMQSLTTPEKREANFIDTSLKREP